MYCAASIPGEAAPDVLICVVDATNLRLHLRFALELRALGKPMVLALNMVDAARKRGIAIDVAALEAAVGVPVVQTVAVSKEGTRDLVAWVDGHAASAAIPAALPPATTDVHAQVRQILDAAVVMPTRTARVDDTLDRWLLHPLFGLLALALTMFLIFQAVYAWATPLMDLIDAGTGALAGWAAQVLPPGSAGQPDQRRHHRRPGRRGDLPAADPDPVRLHPGAGGVRLPAARGLPAGPDDGRGRAVGAFVHPAAVQLCLCGARDHVHPLDPGPARPPGHHPGCTADDLFGAAAGVCAADRCLHPGP
jgi:Fe2+ transport system protein B